MTSPATRSAIKSKAAPVVKVIGSTNHTTTEVLKDAAKTSGITADTSKPPKAKPAPKVKTKPAATKGKVSRKADKPAAKPKVVKVKPAAKEIVAFVARTVKAGTAVHVIAEDARPVSGVRLFAHTHAALTLLGLMSPSRPAVPQKAVLTVMGQRAVTYHTKQGNFEAAPNHGLRLSISGINKFKNRVTEGLLDGKLANAFMALFIDGKVASETGVSSGKVYTTMLAA